LTAYTELLAGHLWTAFTTQMNASLYGWFWPIILLMTDAVLLIKLRKPIVPVAFNIVVIAFLYDGMPLIFANAMLIASGVALALIVVLLFVRKPEPYA